jgi:hypothetical protein
MEIAHEILCVLCGMLDMIAAFQAMVGAHFKLAIIGFLAMFSALVVLGFLWASHRDDKSD